MEGNLAENLDRAKLVLGLLEEGRSAVSTCASSDLGALDASDIWLYRVKEITYEGKAPRREAMENILGALRGIQGLSFIYIIKGNKNGVSFYLGVAKDKREREISLDLEISEVGKEILEREIRGNFRGCRLEEVKSEGRQEILDFLANPSYAGILEGVPSVERSNRMEMQELDFQGTDRLIDVMAGEEFAYVVIAQPYTDSEIREVEEDLCQIYNVLTPLAKYTLQESCGSQESQSVTDGLSCGNQLTSATNENITKSTQKTDTANDTLAENVASSRQHSKQESGTNQATRTDGGNTNSSHDRTETDGGDYESESERTGESVGTSNQVSRLDSTTSLISDSTTQASSKNHSNAKSFSESESQSDSKAETRTQNQTATHSRQDGKTDTSSETRVGQLYIEQKSAVNWVKHIDEVLFPRLDNGKGKGLFLSATYLVVKDSRAKLHRLANTAVSLFSGTKGNTSALHFTELKTAEDGDGEISPEISALSRLQIPSAKINDVVFSQMPGIITALSGRAEERGGEAEMYRADWLSSDELGILTGFPQKEVIGLKLRKEIDFGLNVEDVREDNRIPLGQLVQCGEEKTDIYLDRNDLDKHMFIAGVTGSGKTTTCQKILRECKLPFLVIEPVKSEYRMMKDDKDENGNPIGEDIIYFTPGNAKGAPFFLNPFELFPGESITSRATMLKATMEASFHMEAAIPQILETAVFRAYREKGWNVDNDTWHGKSEKDEDGPFRPGSDAFPTFADFAAAVKAEIEGKGFDDRLRQEYMGTMMAMTDSLLVGIKGQMLNTPKSVSFYDLVDKKVVIELEDIKSGAEKSLLMGFILTNLRAAVMRRHEEDKSFRHITLVEEAHRLLSRYEPGDSLTQKQGVQVFADMLAEVRKYGESLIIVDQIPNKMTPEVLKNTNTKIVHKLFAQDDKDTIGNTMALDEEQKAFLSSLSQGRAVVFSQGWSKAVQVQVKKPETEDRDVPDSEIKERAMKFYSSKEVVKSGVLADLALEAPTEKEVELYFRLLSGKADLIKALQALEKVEDPKEADERVNEVDSILRAYAPLGAETILRVLERGGFLQDENSEEKKKLSPAYLSLQRNWFSQIVKSLVAGKKEEAQKVVYWGRVLRNTAYVLLNINNRNASVDEQVLAGMRKASLFWKRMHASDSDFIENVYHGLYDESIIDSRTASTNSSEKIDVMDLKRDLAYFLQEIKGKDVFSKEDKDGIKEKYKVLVEHVSAIRREWKQ